MLSIIALTMPLSIRVADSSLPGRCVILYGALQMKGKGLMALHISSSTSSIVVSPGAVAFISLNLRNPDGPVSGISIATSFIGDAASVRNTVVVTAGNGAALLEILGASEGRVVVKAGAGTAIQIPGMTGDLQPTATPSSLRRERVPF
jgi:hypothetical protein